MGLAHTIRVKKLVFMRVGGVLEGRLINESYGQAPLGSGLQQQLALRSGSYIFGIQIPVTDGCLLRALCSRSRRAAVRLRTRGVPSSSDELFVVATGRTNKIEYPGRRLRPVYDEMGDSLVLPSRWLKLAKRRD